MPSVTSHLGMSEEFHRHPSSFLDMTGVPTGRDAARFSFALPSCPVAATAFLLGVSLPSFKSVFKCRACRSPRMPATLAGGSFGGEFRGAN